MFAFHVGRIEILSHRPDLHLGKASAKCASGHARKFEDAMAGAQRDSTASSLKGTAECQHWQEAQHSDMPLKN